MAKIDQGLFYLIWPTFILQWSFLLDIVAQTSISVLEKMRQENEAKWGRQWVRDQPGAGPSQNTAKQSSARSCRPRWELAIQLQTTVYKIHREACTMVSSIVDYISCIGILLQFLIIKVYISLWNFTVLAQTLVCPERDLTDNKFFTYSSFKK